jgi:3-(3-hydroxy-phenyl)propionate hydroxylase
MANAGHYDVGIVGLGPVGGTLAALLGREGLSVLVLERSRTIYPEPRAAHVDGEIVRIFQKLGLVARIAPHIRPAPPYEFRNEAGDILMRVPEAEIGPDGWFTHYMIYQPELEMALRKKIADFASVDVRLGAVFGGFRQDEDGVTLKWAADDGAHEARARWLVGCDGGSSPVRRTAGIELDDYGFDEPWLVIDALVADDALLPDCCVQYCHTARPTTCTPLGPGRHRWEFMIVPGDNPALLVEDESIARLLEPWGGPANLLIERKAVYHFHGLVAKRWRDERVLLAGDAAHQMPPFAGQGMCGGIRDAENLAWKLTAVLRGGAPIALLDSVQQEREAQVRGITEMAIEAGKIVCTTDPAVAARRDAEAAERAARNEPAPSLPVPPLGASAMLRADPASGGMFPQFISAARRRSDDVLGSGPWLIHVGAPPVETAGLACFDALSTSLNQFGTAFADWLAERDVPAVLIRPDRVIFGTGPADALARDWQRALAGYVLTGASA